MLYYGLEQQSLDSYFQYKELGSSPGTPPANEIRLYAKDNGAGVSTLCYKNDAGTEICLPTSGSFVTGTGVSGRLAFWNGTSTLSSDADLTFSVDTLTATKIIAPTSITISAFTVGSVVFAGTAGLLSQDNANLFWDDTNNRLGIGTATPDRVLQVQLSGTATQPMSVYNYSGGAATPVNGVIFRSARGTSGSPTAVQTDDTAVVLAFQGYGATAFAGGKRASVEMLPGENWSDTAQGTYLRFLTTPLTSTTVAERFRVGPSGQWGIGGATFGTAGNYFRSGGSAAAPTWQQVKFTELDFTSSNLTSIATRNHSDLAGLTSGDDHTQYALLAGRSGGQTLQGDTASGGDLTLQSTAHATKGTVKITDVLNSTTERSFLLGAVRNVSFFTTAPAIQEIGGTITNNTVGTSALLITTLFNGSAAHPAAIWANPTFQPSSSLTANNPARGIFATPVFDPQTGITIADARVMEFTGVTGSGGGAITKLIGMSVGGPTFGTVVPTTIKGIQVDNQGTSGVTNAIGISLQIPTGATNNYYLEFQTQDNTDPTGGGGAATGRLPCLIGGTLRYLAYY